MRDVRILFVGDRGTGKTSLILAVVKERFEAEVPPLCEEVVIPPDITAAKVTTYIVDSSLRAQDESQIEEEMRKASVVCVVYAVDDSASFQRVTSHWLPTIRRALHTNGKQESVPVVLVGNKIDTRSEEETQAHNLETEIFPIMNSFKEVETCIECSAKRVTNISELITFAQKAVLYPSAPLYDNATRTLKPAAVTALTRVFRLCDFDKDGLLNDSELHAFQTACFNTPLPASELGGLKEVVRGNCSEGIHDNGLTVAGFLFLNRLFIERGHLDTPWTVLRRYGYLDDLTLSPAFIHPTLAVGSDSPVEFSPQGEAFLRDLFRRFDKTGAGFLADEQLQELWATCPPGDPWENCLPTESARDKPRMTLERFLSLWMLFVLDQPERALEYFAYLGYRTFDDQSNDSVVSAVQVMRSRRIDRDAGYTSRQVFLVYVFGQLNSGKSTFLRKADAAVQFQEPLRGQRSAVIPVTARGVQLHLVLREFAVVGADADFVSSPAFAERCDAALFLYDQHDPSSFAYAANLRGRMASGPACLFVATKPDLPAQRQDHPETPAEYCRAHGLPAPLSAQNIDAVFAATANLCLTPSSESTAAAAAPLSGAQRLLWLLAGLGVIAASAFAARHFVRRR
eukprot:m.241347 g.241347  ORF g.241347 m.241347 type:complete len:627 (+) comp13832_c0_seq1:17-1897(+)